jgi:hypothetical protein
MNKIKLLSLGALMVTAMYANAQTTAHTKPTGYVTHTLKAGQFNLIGLTLHNPVVASGDIQGFTGGTQITDSDVNFANVLTAGKTYILEITDAADTSLNGTIQEVTVWGANTFDTPQNLETEGLAVGDKYQLREAATLQQVMGNPATIGSSFTETAADVVWIPDSAAGYTRYFYQPAPLSRWFNATTNTAVAGDIPLIYTDGFFVQIKSTNDVNLILTGSVKTGEIGIAVSNGFNLVSGVYPVGATLANSGLKDTLTSSFTETGADVVWMQDGSGNYTRYFYQPAPLNRWFNATDNVTVVDSTAVNLPSGFFIQRKSTAKNVAITPPAGYDNL